jgi:hypothetical protein
MNRIDKLTEGMIIGGEILDSWTTSGSNWFLKDKNLWGKSTFRFLNERSITSFNYLKGKECFTISDISSDVYISSEGFLEFYNSFFEGATHFRLIKPEFEDAVNLINKNNGSIKFGVDYEISLRLNSIKNLKDLKVYDIWFEEIIGDTLPEINGYQGGDIGEYIQYGCAKLPKNWFTAPEANRSIKTMTLSSGVIISEEDIIKIYNYLR